MADPYSGYNNHPQQSWGQNAAPGVGGYNNAPVPHPSGVPPVAPPPGAAPSPWPSSAVYAQPAYTATPQQPPSLFAFPFVAFSTYLWPTPTAFARHRDQASAGVLASLLALLAAITAVLAYAWGRVPSLSRGMQALSQNHLTPRPLSMALVITLALLLPLLALAFAGILHYAARQQKGQGTYGAQLYSLLAIGTPFVLLCVATTLLLSLVPGLGAVLRIPLTAIALLMLLYNLLLLLPALMGVQGLSMKQAAICLLSLLVVTLLLVFLFNLFGDYDTSSHGGGNRSGDRSFKKVKYRNERLCPRCGFSLAVYDQLRDVPVQACPRCGNPLA